MGGACERQRPPTSAFSVARLANCANQRFSGRYISVWGPKPPDRGASQSLALAMGSPSSARSPASLAARVTDRRAYPCGHGFPRPLGPLPLWGQPKSFPGVGGLARLPSIFHLGPQTAMLPYAGQSAPAAAHRSGQARGVDADQSQPILYCECSVMYCCRWASRASQVAGAISAFMLAARPSANGRWAGMT